MGNSRRMDERKIEEVMAGTYEEQKRVRMGRLLEGQGSNDMTMMTITSDRRIAIDLNKGSHVNN